MYYGDKKVVDIKDVDGGKKQVLLDDGSSVILSVKVAASAISQEPADATKLRELRCYPVVAELLDTLLAHDIHIGEVGFVLQRVKMSIENSCEQATNILWNSEKSGDQLMSDVDRILKGKVDASKVPEPEPQAPEAPTAPTAPSTGDQASA